MKRMIVRSGWVRALRVGSCSALFCAFALCRASSGDAFVNQDKISTSRSLAHYTMGHMYDLLGEIKKAALEYEKAAQFDEAGYLIHLRLGADYARLDLLDDAVKELILAGKYNSEDLQSHYLLALIYSTQKKYNKAAEEYEVILKSFSEAEPQNIEIYGYLGQLYYSQKKFNQAIEQFEKILVLEPQNADIMYLLGSLYIEVNEKNKAVDVLKNSIRIDPSHDGSLNSLGYLYADMGQNFDEAEKLILKALEISPNNGAYLDSLGWVYYKKGKFKTALDYFIKADQELKDPVIYDHLGDAYFKLNDFDMALKNWELSLKLLSGQENIVSKIDKLKSTRASRQQ